jgi:hypothetical protein
MSRPTDEERRFTKEFIKTFYEKFNYYPTVIMSKKHVMDGYNLLSLNQLEQAFKPFLPKQYGKVVNLSDKARIREISELRHMFCFIARSMNFKLKTIGNYLDGRDHSTVINSLAIFKNLHETDQVFREKFKRITNHIKEKYESSIMEHVNKAWN